MVTRLQKIVLVCLMFALVIPAVVMGQGYDQVLGQNKSIDWTRYVIKCTGIGAPSPDQPMAAQRANALRVAKIDAMRNALEVVKGVQLTSATTVENSLMVSDQIKTTVEGAIRGAQVVDTRYMSSGDVEVDIEVPLTGIMMDALLPQDFGGGVLTTGGQLLCPCCGQPWPQGKPVPAGVTLIQAGGGDAVDNLYTGLIIDARGLGITPAMAPKVLDEDSKDVYSAKFISRDYAVDIGMAGYEKDLNRARMNERVTDNPLVVKALKASGPSKSDVVISSVDALKIHNAASNLNFLKHCKVMFILD